HSRTVPSKPDTATALPSLLMHRPRAIAPLAKPASAARFLPCSASHKQTVPSQAQLASVLPSGVKAMPVTMLLWSPSRANFSDHVATSQSFSSPGSVFTSKRPLPEASVLLSELNATHHTPCVCPVSRRASRPVLRS